MKLVGSALVLLALSFFISFPLSTLKEGEGGKKGTGGGKMVL